MAAATYAYASASVEDMCATPAECTARQQYNLANPVRPNPKDEATDPAGGAVRAGLTTSGLLGRTSAIASAEAGVGWLRASAGANGAGTVYRAEPSPMRAEGVARASWSDSLLLSAPGTISGVNVTFSLMLSGGLMVNRSGAETSSALSGISVSVKSPAVYVAPSLGGVNNLDGLSYSQREAAATGTTLTRQTTRVVANSPAQVATTPLPAADPYLLDETWEFTQWFPLGVATTFEVYLQAIANGTLFRTAGPNPGTTADGTGAFGAASDFSYTLEWGGITAIRDASGRDLRGLVSIASDSGADYTRPILAPVPLPPALVSLASGLLVLGLRGVRRRPRH
jgi:hypothetical protein